MNRTITPIPTTHNEAPAQRFTPPADKPRGLKKVTFGAAATKPEKTKTAYPVLPDPFGQAGEIAARILERTADLEALEGALDTDKAELKLLALPFFFETNAGKHEAPSSIAVKTTDGQSEVLVLCKNAYPLLPDEAALLPILGDDVAKYFRQSFDIKIKSASLPEASAQEFVNDQLALATKYNCGSAIEIKQGVKPTKEFHAARLIDLTTEQNMELQAVCPIQAAIGTKGRGNR